MNDIQKVRNPVIFLLQDKAFAQIPINTTHPGVILLALFPRLQIIKGFLQKPLGFHITSESNIQCRRINLQHCFLVIQPMLSAVARSIQIIVQCDRSISAAHGRNSKEIVALSNQFPLFRHIQMGKSPAHGIKEILSIIQTVINLSLIEISKTKKLAVSQLASIFNNIVAALQRYFRICHITVIDLFYPFLNTQIIFLNVHDISSLLQ